MLIHTFASFSDSETQDLLKYLAMLNQNPHKRYSPYQYPSPQINDVLKRAGFVGMRGKKSEQGAMYDEEAFPKRAAFVGMRGRRTPYEVQHEERVLPNLLNFDSSPFWGDEMSLRERRAGFVGMRG